MRKIGKSIQNLPPQLRAEAEEYVKALCENNASPVLEIYEKLEKTDKGQPKQSIGNCLTALQEDPFFTGAIRLNLLTGMVDIVRNLGWERTGIHITDTDTLYIKLYLERNYHLTSEKCINAAIGIVANENNYHPIRDKLDSLVWDGTERIRYALRHFLGADTSDLTYECLKTFMLEAIHRVFSPGCKADYMLCVVGKQGAGNSTFFRMLAMNDVWFTDDIRRLDDDNIFRKIQGHLIIEMSEMITVVNAKSNEELKAFISRQKDTYKVPYEVHPEDRPRQCVFCGTTNKRRFLPFDRTGNRRFIPIDTDPEQAEVHILDDEEASRAYIDQLWAEAMVLYRKGDYSLHFSKENEKVLDELRKDFMEEDPKEGLIQSWLDETRQEYVCSQMIYKEALKHQFDNPKRWETNEICEIMNTCITGWTEGPVHRFSEYGTQRSWVRAGSKECQTSLSGFIELTDDEDLPF